jgi:hypothetical protein
VLSGVKPGMRSFDEEPFGPLVNLVTFRSDDEAVALANHSQGGLSAAVIGQRRGRAPWPSASSLNAGMVHINDQTVNDDCTNPFGGPGLGGNGSFGGRPGRHRRVHALEVDHGQGFGAAVSFLKVPPRAASRHPPRGAAPEAVWQSRFRRCPWLALLRAGWVVRW